MDQEKKVHVYTICRQSIFTKALGHSEINIRIFQKDGATSQLMQWFSPGLSDAGPAPPPCEFVYPPAGIPPAL